VMGSRVKVHAKINVPVRKEDTLCLLNELSAAWFTSGWEGEDLAPPPPGWEKVSPDQLPVSLVDPVHGIRFSINQVSVSLPVPVTICRGRELNQDHCWAGFCIQLGTGDESEEMPEVHYTIGITAGASL